MSNEVLQNYKISFEFLLLNLDFINFNGLSNYIHKNNKLTIKNYINDSKLIGMSML